MLGNAEQSRAGNQGAVVRTGYTSYIRGEYGGRVGVMHSVVIETSWEAVLEKERGRRRTVTETKHSKKMMAKRESSKCLQIPRIKRRPNMQIR